MTDWRLDLETCASTNTWAMQRLASLPHGTVVATRRQTAGRGRDGRTWQAPEGTMTFSVVLAAGADAAGPLALAAGLACVHALADACPMLAAALTVKWPNDVLLHHRKVAGILCEGADGRLVVGIGLNRAAVLPAGLDATSVHHHATPPDADALLTAIRSYLLEAAGLCALRGLDPLLPDLRARDALLGRSVRVGAVSGTAAGIDGAGRLLVVVPGGGVAAVDSGHVEVW